MPFDPISALGLAASLGTNAYNAYSQSKTNQEERDFAREMQRRSQYYNEYNWNLQNAYNHPTQQMQRLQEAGLNPHLVYGGGAANISDAIKSPSAQGASAIAPKLNPTFMNDISQYQNIQQTRQHVQNLQAQEANTRQDTLLKNAQTLDRLEQAGISKANKKIATKTADSIINQIHYETASKASEMLIKNVEQEKAERLFKVDIQKALLQNAKTKAEIRLIKDKSTLAQYEAMLNKLGIQKNDPMYFRILSNMFNKAAAKLEVSY